MDNSRSAGRNPRMPPGARGGPPPLHGPGGAPTLRSPHSDVGRGNSQQDLVERFGAQRLDNGAPNKVARPDVGTRGSTVNLRANLFELKFPKDIVMFDYVISINPYVPTTEVDLRRQIVNSFVESRELSPYVQGIAHDGTQRLIARGEIRNLSATVRPENGGEYVVTLNGPKPKLEDGEDKPAGPFEPRRLNSKDLVSFLRGANPGYNPLPILTAIRLIVTANASRAAVHRSGKSAYYYGPDKGEELHFPDATYVEALYGFIASLRPVSNRLVVNINACVSTFFVPQARLSDAMIEYARKSNGMQYSIELYNKVKVTTTYHGYRRQYKVKQFGPDSAARTTVNVRETNSQESVEQYFRRKFGITLKHANDLPVVNIGTKDRDVFVPAELCQIERGSSFTGPLSEKEAAMLSDLQSGLPQNTAKTISVKGLRLLGLNSNAPPMSSFKIDISVDMASVRARVLPAPNVVYEQGPRAPDDGSWSSRDIRFVKAAKVSTGKLVVLVVRDGGEDDFTSVEDPAMVKAVKGLLAKCQSRGMAFQDPRPNVRTITLPEESRDDPSRTRAISMIEKTLGEFSPTPQLALVLLSDKDKNIYAGLKRVGDTKKGIQTICALMSSIRMENDQSGYMSSLSLRMNAKLGGVNHTLEPGPLNWLKDTIVIGMHVSRPGPGSPDGAPSVAAVVGSCDMGFVQYPASLGIQEAGKETIKDVKKMVVQRMKEYKDHTKDYPQRVIVFRGAASEGATTRLMKEEVVVLQKALSELTHGPKLTYVTYSKGHQTRFYSPNESGRSSAGTVVDQQVTSVSDFDFFLQSHGGNQGIPRVTRYTVLVDENKYSSDVLQQGINSLCYLWAPATKSVSIVPAAYWADRACERARLYLHQVLDPIPGGEVSRMREKDVIKKVQELWGGGVHSLLGNAMFYL